MTTLRELVGEGTFLAFQAMLELRPHIGSQSQFVKTVQDRQRPEGYRLVGVFATENEQAAAVCGFRTLHTLAWGFTLYCDDLSTRADFRGRGYAGKLIDWMIAEARRLGCEQFHLDSGVGAERLDAHRLYFNKRMRIAAHHFALELRAPSPTEVR